MIRFQIGIDQNGVRTGADTSVVSSKNVGSLDTYCPSLQENTSCEGVG